MYLQGEDYFYEQALNLTTAPKTAIRNETLFFAMVTDYDSLSVTAIQAPASPPMPPMPIIRSPSPPFAPRAPLGTPPASVYRKEWLVGGGWAVQQLGW